MTALTAFWATFGPALVAAALALAVDAFSREAAVRRRATLLAALVLAGGGAVGIWVAWTRTSEVAFGSISVGGVYSAVPGVAFVLAAAVIAAAADGPRASQSAGLIALGTASGALAAASGDLVSMLIGIEGAAICAYALVYAARTKRSAEAAMKYFIQGSVATGIFVLGVAVLVSVFATDATLEGLVTRIAERPSFASAAVFGALALLSALAFKVGAAPMHSWAPDVYETAPAPAAAALAGAGKLAMTGTLAVVFANLAAAGISENGLGVITSEVLGSMGVFAFVSIVFGSTVALTTKSLRRMLGYAGVAQVGYALIALTAVSPAAALLFTATYAVATTVAFLAAAAIEQTEPGWDGSVEGVTGLAFRMPGVSFALTAALISLAGIPPLLGFWGKFQTFGAAVQAATLFTERGEVALGIGLVVLAVTGIIGSVISLGYYGRVVRALFTPAETAACEVDPAPGPPSIAAAVCIVLAVALVILGLLPLVAGPSALVRGFGF